MDNVYELFPASGVKTKLEASSKAAQQFDELDSLFCLAGRNKRVADCAVCGEQVPKRKGYRFEDAFSDAMFITHRGDCSRQSNEGGSFGKIVQTMLLLTAIILMLSAVT